MNATEQEFLLVLNESNMKALEAQQEVVVKAMAKTDSEELKERLDKLLRANIADMAHTKRELKRLRRLQKFIRL